MKNLVMAAKKKLDSQQQLNTKTIKVCFNYERKKQYAKNCHPSIKKKLKDEKATEEIK